MSIPTMQERIETKFGEEMSLIELKLNHAILTGYRHTNNSGQYYYETVIGDYWPDEELTRWITDKYLEAGWILEFNRDTDVSNDTTVQIFKHI